MEGRGSFLAICAGVLGTAVYVHAASTQSGIPQTQAQVLRVTALPTTPPRSVPGECALYVLTGSGQLYASCGGGPYTLVVGAPTSTPTPTATATPTATFTP